MMFKKIVVLAAAAFLMGACEQPQPATAPPPPPPPPPTASSFMVFFDFDRSNLTAQAAATVKQAADAYRSSGNARVTATGHADRVGSDAYNMALSLRRANSVKNALVTEGVPATSITVVGRGESQPLVPTPDGVAEPQNRRVEIVIGGTALPAAHPDDVAYCRALTVKYREFFRGADPTPQGPAAIAQCEAGNPAGGIPMLERLLTDARVPLPPR